jgi:hypothetical protein
MHPALKRVAAAAAVAAMAATPAFGASTTTVQRTIGDRDGDNILDYLEGEDYTLMPSGGSATAERRPNTASILNFLQLSDFQAVDEESPGRVEFLDTTQRAPGSPFSAAYRPQEAMSTQVTEAMVRQARNTTSQITGEPLDLTILTGDNADSQQYNETRWFIDTLDGDQTIDPDSGIGPECDTTPNSDYDGPDGGGKLGFYDPDGPNDGDGYSHDRTKNQMDTLRDVTVRDFPGLHDRAQDPFRAIGIDMPWYTAFGNHDALIQGNDSHAYFGPGGLPPNPPNDEASNPVLQDFVTDCLKPGKATSLSIDPQAAFDAFIADPAGYAQNSTTDPLTVPPDPRRCYVAKDEPEGGGAPAPCDTGGWVQQHFLTTGAPVGHGLAPALAADCNVPARQDDCQGALTDEERQVGYGRPHSAVVNHDGYYSFSPRQGLRFIVLDSITDECGPEACSEGSIDSEQYDWMGQQIDAAAGEGEYVLVFAHHTLRSTRSPNTDPTEVTHYGELLDRRSTPPQPVASNTNPTVEELLCNSPNVLAYVAGHEHQNYVLHHSCADDAPPTPGAGDFWEVSTAAHIDWPQQSRMIELFHQTDGEMALALTVLDHDGPANPGGPPPTPSQGDAGDQVLRLASIGRELAFNDYQLGPKSGAGDARGGDGDRNVIIDLDRPFPCEESCQPSP